eukprot:2170639-Amphidinium_carterae.1
MLPTPSTIRYCDAILSHLAFGFCCAAPPQSSHAGQPILAMLCFFHPEDAVACALVPVQRSRICNPWH